MCFGRQLRRGIELEMVRRRQMSFVVVIKVKNLIRFRSRTNVNRAADRTTPSLEAILFHGDIVGKSMPKDAGDRFHWNQTCEGTNSVSGLLGDVEAFIILELASRAIARK